MKDTEKKPVVSIICLTYNHAPYIRECLDGFMMQETDFTFEVIIHDDASTDGATDIVKEYAAIYPDIIKPIIQTENQYSKHNDFNVIMKLCLDRCGGKYIAFCEGDDYWIDPLKLQKQVDFLKNNSEFGMICSDCHKLMPDGAKIYHQHTTKEALILSDILYSRNKISTLTVVLKRKLLNDYPFEIISKYNWPLIDFPMWIWILSKEKCHHMNWSTSIYRVLNNSASHNPDEKKQFLFSLSIFEIQETMCKLLHRRNLFPIYIRKLLFIIQSVAAKPSKDIYRMKYLFIKAYQKNEKII